MTAVSEDASADLKRRVAELEQRLDTALVERDAAIDRQTASALVNFRLQNEVRTALERQKAGAEILRRIAATGGAGRVAPAPRRLSPPRTLPRGWPRAARTCRRPSIRRTGRSTFRTSTTSIP